MKRYGFGIDVGGTAIKMGLFTTDGELIEKTGLPGTTCWPRRTNDLTIRPANGEAISA